MIGYVSSADLGDYRKIKITVMHSDDFALAEYGCEKDVYLADRFSGLIQRITNDSDNPSASLTFLRRLMILLKHSELTCKFAVCIKWRSVGSDGAELVGVELLDGVWLPLPVTNDTAKGLCINVTKLFFDKTPKPFETSFVCDILNLLVLNTGINISNPFYGVHTDVFCNSEILYVLRRLFNKDFLAYEIMKPVNDKLQKCGELNKISKPYVNVKQVMASLESSVISKTGYDGTDHYFLVGAKRDCISELMKDMSICIRNGYELDYFAQCLKNHIKKAFERVMALGEILVLKGHLQRLSDIHYLEFYELLEAFAFQEKALELKTLVRESANRIRMINKIEIPDYISSDMELKYIGKEE